MERDQHLAFPSLPPSRIRSGYRTVGAEPRWSLNWSLFGENYFSATLPVPQKFHPGTKNDELNTEQSKRGDCAPTVRFCESCSVLLLTDVRVACARCGSCLLLEACVPCACGWACSWCLWCMLCARCPRLSVSMWLVHCVIRACNVCVRGVCMLWVSVCEL